MRLWFALLWASAAWSAPGIQAPARLRCEYLANPPAIDVRAPRFSWVPRHNGRNQIQTAYQIVVSGAGRTEWDSGKVITPQTVQVAYGGSPLRSNREYVWRVRYWDREGRASPFSETATFHTGLLESGDWKAQWIAGGNEFRKEFAVPGHPRRARVFVSAAGFYELQVNGRRVGDAVLDPAWTDFRNRALYSAYDVMTLLRRGANTLVARVGLGRGPERSVLAQLEIETDAGAIRVSSDETWSARDGPARSDSIYDGEVYDAVSDVGPWHPARLAGIRPAALSAQTIPPIRVVSTLRPVARRGGVFDFGELMSGWTRLRVTGPRGSTIRVQYGEALLPDGSIDRSTLRNAKAEDTYILRGAGEETWEPSFTYHGFRYVQVAGPARTVDLEARSIRTDAGQAARFTSSSDYLNRLQAAVVRSIGSNLMGIPTDNNQRDERLGWLGDAHIAGEVAALNFDLAAFYTKYLRDIADAQKEDGSLPNVVPLVEFNGVHNVDPAWESAYILLCHQMYRQYGDRRILEQHYGGLERSMRHLRRLSGGGLLSNGRFGDWIALEETPPNLVANFYFIRDAEAFAEIGEALGRNEVAAEYRALAAELRNRYRAAYAAEHSQTALALAIELGLPGRDALVRALEENLARHDGHLTTGIVGTRFLLPALTSAGRSDLAYRIVTQTTYPGWGYMLANGATALWELWRFVPERRMKSHNQPMLATVGTWFYEALAGIRRDGTKLSIQPETPEGLSSVAAAVQTQWGEVGSSWTRRGDRILLRVAVPVNAVATVRLPTGEFAAGSGEHRFEWRAR